MKRVLFVCLGNICRSPMAQGVMEHYIKTHNLSNQLSCDSAGTGSWHVGELADFRTRTVLQNQGIRLDHRARTLFSSDFDKFDLILTMDRWIHQEVLKRSPKPAHDKIRLYRDFDPQGSGDLEDPYYGTQQDFEEVYQVCLRTTPQIVKYLVNKKE